MQEKNKLQEQYSDIIIVGAGSGGFQSFVTLQKLIRKYRLNKTITLIDSQPFFTFVPLLHEVSAGTISGDAACVPLAPLVRSPHQFLNTTVTRIDPTSKLVLTESGSISYDHCIIATGSTTNFFGVSGAAEHAHTVRTRAEAERLAAAIDDLCRGSAQATITVVGGGYTGVEVAGEIGHRMKHHKHVSVQLIHGRDDIAPTMPPALRKKSARALERLGVRLILNTRVTGVTPTHVEVTGADPIPSSLTIWTTGFLCTGDSLVVDPDGSLTDRGRYVVDDHLQTRAPHVWAVGDVALITDPSRPKEFYPQLAESAYDAGIYLAHHIVHLYRNKTTKPFVFHQKGSLLPLGWWYAVGTIGRFSFSGWWLWIIRQGVYVVFLPTLRAKVRLVREWVVGRG